jgi:hypothetical protein
LVLEALRFCPSNAKGEEREKAEDRRQRTEDRMAGWVGVVVGSGAGFLKPEMGL